MAADLKIRIAADNTGAMKVLQDMEKELGQLGGSVSSYVKQLKNVKGTSEEAFATETLNKKIQATVNSYIAAGKGVQGFEKSLRMLRNTQQELLSSGLLEQAKGLQSTISTTEEQMKRFTGTVNRNATAFSAWGKRMGEILKNIMGFQLVIATVRKGMTAVTNLFKNSSAAAAEMEQRMSKLSTVFSGLDKISTKSVDNLSKSIGVARSTAASALSTVGDLLQAQGMDIEASLQKAEEWTQRFQDIIAFKDVDMSLEEFAQNFMSGAAGNLRNFRTFGSIVKESAVQDELARKKLDKLTGSQLELAKMTIRAEMALEQQKNSIGATTREWDTMLSVSRRYSEEMKRFKENFGEQLNVPLRETKKLWTDIVQDMNIAYEARKKLAELEGKTGSKNQGSDRFTENQKDFTAFLVKYFDSHGANNTNYNHLAEIGYETYGLSQQEMLDVFSNLHRSSNTMAVALIDVKERLEEVAALEERRANAIKSVKSTKESYSSLIENLSKIVGVKISDNFSDIEFGSGRGSAAQAAAAAQWHSGNSIANVLGQLNGMSLSAFGNKIDVALGDDYTKDALKEKLKAYRSLYEEAYNYYILNNKDHELTEENTKLLNKIKDGWTQAKASLDTYNASLKNSEKITNAIGKLRDIGAKAYLSGLGGDNRYVEKYNAYSTYKEGLEALEKTYGLKPGTLKPIGSESIDNMNAGVEGSYKGTRRPLSLVGDTKFNSELSDLEATVKQVYKSIDTKYNAEERDKLNKDYDNAMQQLKDDFLKDYNSVGKELKQLNMTEKEKALDDAREYFGRTGDTEKEEDLLTRIENLFAAQEKKELKETVSSDFKSMFGNAGKAMSDMFKGIREVATGDSIKGVKDLWSAIFALLQQSEAFNLILEGTQEAISGLDSVLKPFIPYIQMVNDQIKMAMGYLAPLIPVMKVLASVMTILQTVIMSIVDLILGTVMKAVSVVAKGFLNMYNAIVDIFGNIGWGKIKVGKITLLPSFNLADALGMHHASTPDWVKEFGDTDMFNQEKIWDDMAHTLRQIWETDEEIAFNTSKENDEALKLLEKQLANGIISANTFNAMANDYLGGNPLDTVRSNGSFNNGYSAGTVNNHVNIRIDGTGLSAAELDSALYSALERAGMLSGNDLLPAPITL